MPNEQSDCTSNGKMDSLWFIIIGLKRGLACVCAPNADSGFSSALHRSHSYASHRLTRVLAHSPHPLAPCSFFFALYRPSNTHMYASIEHNQQPNRHHGRCNLLVKCNAAVTGLDINRDTLQATANALVWHTIERTQERKPNIRKCVLEHTHTHTKRVGYCLVFSVYCIKTQKIN